MPLYNLTRFLNIYSKNIKKAEKQKMPNKAFELNQQTQNLQTKMIYSKPAPEIMKNDFLSESPSQIIPEIDQNLEKKKRVVELKEIREKAFVKDKYLYKPKYQTLKKDKENLGKENKRLLKEIRLEA
jgi:hypothetical protein